MNELICLAVALYFETRSEPMAGQIAVSQVIIHRVESPRYPNTICKVVKQGGERKNRCQFSYFCDGRSEVPKDQEAWDRAKGVAEYVLQNNDKIYDFSEGSLHYYNPTLADPAWARAAKSSVHIGEHRFVRF